LVLLAALVMIVANVGALVGAWRNRSAPVGGTLELTERELTLPPLVADSTVLALEMRWGMAAGDSPAEEEWAWLTAAKLQQLGFDCRLPATDPHARAHYMSMCLRPVFVVLECRGDAASPPAHSGLPPSRLRVVDAGTDPVRLRQQHPDASRQAIARGLVALRFETVNPVDRKPLPEPRVRGRIVELLPGTVFMPKPHSDLLLPLRRPPSTSGAEPSQSPRYAVTVCWGAHYEPWVRSVRLLP
jgi:hypothetical protein